MALELLPDWQDPIACGGATLLRPWAPGGAFSALPSALALDHDGAAPFRLELVRGATPSLPPAPYGVLELRLRAEYELERAVEPARGIAPDARVERSPIADGWLHLAPMGDGSAPEDLRVPMRLSANGIEGLVWVLRVSSRTALLLRGVLDEDALALEAWASVEVEAVAPRLDVWLSFVPAELLGRIATAAGATVTRADLVALLTDALPTLPLEVNGPDRDVSADRLAERLADLVRSRYADGVAPPEGTRGIHLALAERPPARAVEIDLSLPESTRRPLELSFDPLGAVRARGKSAFALVESVIPPFPTGAHEVEVYANLPRDHVGILAIGVDLVAPARPPRRVQPAVATVEIPVGVSTVTKTMRLAPGEQPEIEATPYAVVRDATGIERLEGETSVLRGRTLELAPDAWPLSFVRLGATPDLLTHGAVEFTVAYALDGRAVSARFAPDAAKPSASLAIAATATDVTVAATLTSPGGASLTVGPRPGLELLLDLFSFAGYGPRLVEVSCDLPAGVDSYAVDLVPMGYEDDAGAVTVLLLTRAQPEKAWRFWSGSPFGGTFRHRPHPGPDEVAAAWSDPAPAGRLRLTPAVPA